MIRSIMALALLKQLAARGIDRSLADCEKIIAGLLEEAAAVADEVTARHKVRTA